MGLFVFLDLMFLIWLFVRIWSQGVVEQLVGEFVGQFRRFEYFDVVFGDFVFEVVKVFLGFDEELQIGLYGDVGVEFRVFDIYFDDLVFVNQLEMVVVVCIF